jgi:hypothetical protein
MYVYVFDFGNNKIKVGRTKNVEKRIQQVENQSGDKVLRHFKIETEKNHEKYLHKLLDNYHRSGEYYNYDYQTVCDELKREEDSDLNGYITKLMYKCLELSGKNINGLSEYLNIPINRIKLKLEQETFSIIEMIKIFEYADTKLAVLVPPENERYYELSHEKIIKNKIYPDIFKGKWGFISKENKDEEKNIETNEDNEDDSNKE